MQKNESDNVTHEDLTVVDLIAYRLKQQVDLAATPDIYHLALTLQDMYYNEEINVTMENGSMIYAPADGDPDSIAGHVIIDMCKEETDNND